MSERNLFAYTDPKCDYPGFISINEGDAKEIWITLREPGEQGRRSASFQIPHDQLKSMCEQVLSKL